MGKLRDYELKLDIDDSVTPVTQRPRPVPFQLREKVKVALEELISEDIIEPVNTPSEWVSPVVIVPKSDSKVRICVDMRSANQDIKRIKYPFPTGQRIGNPSQYWGQFYERTVYSVQVTVYNYRLQGDCVSIL